MQEFEPVRSEKSAGILVTDNIFFYPHVVLPIPVRQPNNILLIQQAIRTGEHILVAIKKPTEGAVMQNVALDSVSPVATEVQVIKAIKLSPDNYSVTLQGIRRVRILREDEESGDASRVIYEELEDIPLDPNAPDAMENEAIWRSVKLAARQITKSITEVPKDIALLLSTLNDQGQYCDIVAANFGFSLEDKIAILAALNIRERLQLTLRCLTKRIEILLLSTKIQSQVKEEIDKSQREFFLRQQLKAIKDQLGESQTEDFDLEELREKVRNEDLPDEVRKACEKQLSRLQLMQPASSEYSVARTYLETLLDIPWLKTTEDNLSVSRARTILDEDHYDLEKVKKRIVEFLAVLSLKNDLKGPILCLYGPPGVGKTSLGKSVARALGRKFYRFSLGGMHDESEIRGHRRTYVGALPGRIIQALRKVGTMNPVIMLDEIDKVGKDFRGDPASALLEVLDPEQNSQFNDHYVELAVDLSHVLFIATANQLDTISPPLRDRMEIIEIPGYTHHDKIEIARRFLMPKILENHGIREENLKIDDEALNILINNHTREAGVRGMEHRLSDIARAAAVAVADARDTGNPEPEILVTADNIEEYLGPIRFEYEVAMRTSVPGVATGLAWTPAGGDILFIEVTSMPGKGEFVITGKLGDVMQESIRAAFSYIRSHAEELGLPEEFNKNIDLHIHVPAGAVPKDGPSAGITIFSAILSLFLKKCVRNDLAMTGEITLLGHVLPVGGIKEKVLGAHRAGIRNIIMPERNRRDLTEIKEEILSDMHFSFVSSVRELLPLIFKEND